MRILLYKKETLLYSANNRHIFTSFLQVETDASIENSKTKLRSEVINQIKDLFELKQLGAITGEEYEEKKKILLKYI